jgi:hypothetical protein
VFSCETWGYVQVLAFSVLFWATILAKKASFLEKNGQVYPVVFTNTTYFLFSRLSSAKNGETKNI